MSDSANTNKPPEASELPVLDAPASTSILRQDGSLKLSEDDPKKESQEHATLSDYKNLTDGLQQLIDLKKKMSESLPTESANIGQDFIQFHLERMVEARRIQLKWNLDDMARITTQVSQEVVQGWIREDSDALSRFSRGYDKSLECYKLQIIYGKITKILEEYNRLEHEARYRTWVRYKDTPSSLFIKKWADKRRKALGDPFGDKREVERKYGTLLCGFIDIYSGDETRAWNALVQEQNEFAKLDNFLKDKQQMLQWMEQNVGEVV